MCLPGCPAVTLSRTKKESCVDETVALSLASSFVNVHMGVRFPGDQSSGTGYEKERTDGGSSVENEIEIDDAFFFFDTVDEPSDISNGKAAGE
jgi:hypothetical protein